jgi:hypothetical protein
MSKVSKVTIVGVSVGDLASGTVGVAATAQVLVCTRAPSTIEAIIGSIPFADKVRGLATQLST